MEQKNPMQTNDGKFNGSPKHQINQSIENENIAKGNATGREYLPKKIQANEKKHTHANQNEQTRLYTGETSRKKHVLKKKK